MSRFLVLLGLAIILFMTDAASAAEYGNWTGFYIGADAGWIRTDAEFENTGGWFGGDTSLVFDAGKENDAIFGVHAGYNWQVDKFVFGGEATIGYAGIENRACFDAFTGASSTCAGNYSLEKETKWLSTIKARAGLDLGQWMPFISGGLSIADVDTTMDATIDGIPKQTVSDTKYGYAVGGGVEYMFTHNILFRLEGMYFDLGEDDTFFDQVDNTAIFRSDNTGFIITAGISYKF